MSKDNVDISQYMYMHLVLCPCCHGTGRISTITADASRGMLSGGHKIWCPFCKSLSGRLPADTPMGIATIAFWKAYVVAQDEEEKQRAEEEKVADAMREQIASKLTTAEVAFLSANMLKKRMNNG